MQLGTVVIVGARRKSRELALQFLYLVDVAKMSPEDAEKALFQPDRIAEAVRTFSKHLALGTLAQIETLDAHITKYAENWELHRMTAVDRNLLRMAAFELIHDTETPISVIIDEAVEIAKVFSTEDSGKFVNGILDKIKLERKDGSRHSEEP